MAFAKKVLRVTFTLVNGTFAGTGQNTLTVSGLRTQVTVKNAGMFAGCHLDLVVYGLTFSQMNDISILGIQLQTQAVLRNQVTVEASSDGGASFYTVFIGAIQTAYADLAGMPDAIFRLTANSIAAINVLPAQPGGINQGAVSVATLLSSLAQQAGLQFENNANINVTLRYPYLWGSVYDQIKELCAAAGINWSVVNNTLAIWPKNGSRSGNGATVPIVSAATGLVAFPSYTPNGILLKTLYNPAILFGGSIEVQSKLLTAAAGTALAAAVALPINGVYAVNELDHELESWVPNGKWFSDIQAINPAFFVVPTG